jgi:hypothetical protein
MKRTIKDSMRMEGVREYGEGYPVELSMITPEKDVCLPFEIEEGDRLVLRAFNEGHCNCTEIDLLDLIQWLKGYHPDLLRGLEGMA